MTTSAPAAPVASAPDTATTGSPAAPTSSAPAPSTPAAPSTPSADPAAPVTPAANPQTPPDPNVPPAYKVPDAYKDKPWAAKIKSEEDLWKALDGSQALIGKKHLPLDPTKATKEQIEEYKAAHRPADKAEYKFGDNASDAEREAIGGILFESGIPAWQANQVIEQYTKLQEAGIAKLYDKDSYMTEMQKSFGPGYEANVGRVVRALDAVLSPEDKALLGDTPNLHLATIYRAVHSFLEKYGVEDTGKAAGTPPGPQAAPNDDQEAADVLKELQALDGKPHTQEQRDALIAKRAAIFDRKANKR